MHIIGLITLLFSSSAMAQAAAAKGPSMIETLMMPAGIVLIMYFFMIRPQQKKAKEHANLLTSLKKGDEVVTSGGLIGKIRTVSDTFVTVDVANNVSIKVIKQHVSGLTKAPDAATAKSSTPAKA